MKRSINLFLSGLSILFLWSCGQQESAINSQLTENRIVQQDDGTVSLKLEKAACYNDASNPSNNTADWNVVISKPGRFKVWLSSATKDTSNLRYENSVRISFMDDHLEANPACDKVIQNSGEVPFPYYRADSYIGTFYVSEPGEYNIQVISEKVIAKNAVSQNNSSVNDTKMMSVILTPALR